MAIIETSSGNDVSVTQLVAGIVSDAQDLGLRHLALLRSELLETMRQTRAALVSVAIGLALVLIGGLLVGHMAAHLLSQLFPTLPLWGSYAIVGGVLSGCGAIPLMSGIARLQNMKPLTDDRPGKKETAK